MPWRADLVFIPLSAYAYAPLLVVLLYWIVLPTRALAATGVLAHFALALHYEWFHNLAHTRYQPRSAWYRRIWRNHRLHHFRNEHYWFGVTMLSGDRLLRTAPGAEGVPRSKTCMALEP